MVSKQYDISSDVVIKKLFARLQTEPFDIRSSAIRDFKLYVSDFESNFVAQEIYKSVQLIEIDNFLKKLTSELTRIATLSIEENITINPSSKNHLQKFFQNLERPLELPALFLLDNGDTRALWRKEKNQIGLQFLEDGLIQYVLIREEGEKLHSSYGRVSSESILPLIKSMHLESLLYEKG